MPDINDYKQSITGALLCVLNYLIHLHLNFGALIVSTIVLVILTELSLLNSSFNTLIQGVLMKPKVNDTVRFKTVLGLKMVEKIGVVRVIDNPKHDGDLTRLDIMVDSTNTLHKHVPMMFVLEIIPTMKELFESGHIALDEMTVEPEHYLGAMSLDNEVSGD